MDNRGEPCRVLLTILKKCFGSMIFYTNNLTVRILFLKFLIIFYQHESYIQIKIIVRQKVIHIPFAAEWNYYYSGRYDFLYLFHRVCISSHSKSVRIIYYIRGNSSVFEEVIKAAEYGTEVCGKYFSIRCHYSCNFEYFIIHTDNVKN